MVWSIATPSRRRRLVHDAAESRASWARRLAAAISVIVYNMVGVCDIYSTALAIDLGAGQEANPFIRLMMIHAGDAWVLGKLALQAVISVMVVWFPHWFVVGLFAVATAGNAYIVYNNLVIAGVF